MPTEKGEWVPPDCFICGACLGHAEWCADRARSLLKAEQRKTQRLAGVIDSVDLALDDARVHPLDRIEVAQGYLMEYRETPLRRHERRSRT